MSVFSLHIYCCAGCETKIRIWTLVSSRDNQRIVAIADLKVQFFYCCNPPLNAHTHPESSFIAFSPAAATFLYGKWPLTVMLLM